MAIRPLNDRVVVRRIEAETRSAGGIVIPGAAAEKPAEGDVLAIGPGEVMENGRTRPLSVKVGDRVLFGRYSGSEVKHAGEKLLVLRETEILAVIDEHGKVEQAA